MPIAPIIDGSTPSQEPTEAAKAAAANAAASAFFTSTTAPVVVPAAPAADPAPSVAPVVDTGTTQQAYPSAIGSGGALVNDDIVVTAPLPAAPADVTAAASASTTPTVILAQSDPAPDPSVEYPTGDAYGVTRSATPAVTTQAAEAGSDGATAASQEAQAADTQKKTAVDSAADAFTAMADSLSSMQVFDVYDVPDASIITFSCPNKGVTVQGLLTEPLSFSLESKWEHKALGPLVDSNVATMTDTILQDAAGLSINQPVLNRRTWGGTEPLVIDTKVKFIAQQDSIETVKAQVYDKVILLATLLVPRVMGTLAESSDFKGILSAFAIPGPAPFGGAAAKQVAHLFNADMQTGYGGDSVSIGVISVVGVTESPIILLNKAYLSKLVATFSKALGPDGFPLAAECSVTFGAMDTPMVTGDKTGNITGNMKANNILINSTYGSDDFTQAIASLLSRAGVWMTSFKDNLAGKNLTMPEGGK